MQYPKIEIKIIEIISVSNFLNLWKQNKYLQAYIKYSFRSIETIPKTVDFSLL